MVLKVGGTDRLWAFKSHIEIPLEHISGVRIDPQEAHRWLKGVKEVGARIPGIIKVGTFYEQEGQVFWDVHNPEKTIIIELSDERYRELVIEVEDPKSALDTIEGAIR
jgi:hypothetical protein